jgi:hypothetical protein
MLLKAAQLGGAHMMFEAFVNSPPWFMTKSGTSRCGAWCVCDQALL